MKYRLLAAVMSVFLAYAPESLAQEKIVTIGTGAVNGIYYPAGGAICRLMNRARKEHGIRCFSESTGGSINNIHGLQDGELNFAITQSDWQYKAYKGEGLFADSGAYADMRSVFSLHSEMFTVAVAKQSGIKTFAELKGKRINIGDAGSGMREMVAGVTEALRWKTADMAKAAELKPAEAVQALCNGTIDAMVFAVGHPNGLIQEVTSRCGAKLIPVSGAEIDALLSRSPYYSRTAIPGGMYQGNATNIPTFGVKAALITTAAQDEESVYQLTKSVFENFESFKTLHFVFATLDKERMVTTGLIAPLHPGAARYYREVGLLK